MINAKMLDGFTRSILAKAGWSLDRDRSDLLGAWEIGFFKSEPFNLHDFAREALIQLAGLSISQSGKGRTCARRSFWFDPTGAAGEYDRFREFELHLNARLCPIGEADDGDAFLAVADDGRVLCLMDDAWVIGASMEEALNSLVLGEIGQEV